MSLSGTIILRALPFFFLLIALEAIHLHREQHHRHIVRRLAADIGVAFGSILISILTNGFIFLFYLLLYSYRALDLSSASPFTWLLAFLGDDFSWYWFHRVSHSVRFFWASHAVHHSPEVFTLSGGTRVPWTSNITGNFLFWSWMPLIGIEPVLIVVMKSVSLIYQFWLHTEYIRKLPRWFEFIFNTPSHHRVHHSSNVEYLDKNHGGILIIWDRMFRTFEPEQNKTVYGLTKGLNSNNPVVIAFHEWTNLFKDLRRARNVREWLNYAFNSPGWSPDGSSKTTRQLRKEMHHHKLTVEKENDLYPKVGAGA